MRELEPDPVVGRRAFFAGETAAVGGEIIASGTPEHVVATLGPGERAFVVLPFDPTDEPVAHRVRPQASATVPRPLRRRLHSVRETPSADEYAQRVSDALRLIGESGLEKVVLGRGVELTSHPPLEVEEVLAQLMLARPGRYVFAVPMPEGTLLGASPELLVRRSGDRVTSLPLAGSIPRSADPVDDVTLAVSLRASAKDLAEHKHVVDHVLAVLRPLARTLVAPDVPEPISTDTMWHLATPISAELVHPAPDALRLARLLHPTPAVGGVPTSDALAAIADLERSSRGALTGAVGWVDADGDGEFALAIRSGVLRGSTMRLYAGAGIVAGSDPRAEARETGAKLATMLTAVGAR